MLHVLLHTGYKWKVLVAALLHALLYDRYMCQALIGTTITSVGLEGDLDLIFFFFYHSSTMQLQLCHYNQCYKCATSRRHVTCLAT